MHGVVYCTHSYHTVENETVVSRAIEHVNLTSQRRLQFTVSPPVLPMSDFNITSKNPVDGKFLRYPASNMMSGCFLATIVKEVTSQRSTCDISCMCKSTAYHAVT